MIMRKRYKGNRNVLKGLYKKHKGKCCYCGCQTVMPISGQDGKPANNMATIEHKYSNYSLIRMIIGRWSKTILSCWECNQKRCLKDNKEHIAGYDYCDNHDGLLISILESSISS